MKKLLLTLVTVFCSIVLFAQEADIKKTKTNTYKFNHTLSMDSERIDRYKFRLMSECVEIKKVKINENSCTIEFKKDIPQDRISKILLYSITIFDFKSYKIINE